MKLRYILVGVMNSNYGDIRWEGTREECQSYKVFARLQGWRVISQCNWDDMQARGEAKLKKEIEEAERQVKVRLEMAADINNQIKINQNETTKYKDRQETRKTHR